jgi:cyclic beta-1,2-glucan synthetase
MSAPSAPVIPLERHHDAAPHGRWLSNGRYRVLVTGAGTGASLWDSTALTRFRGDGVEDADGLFVWLREPDRDAAFSLGRQPTPGDDVRRSADAAPGVFRLAAERDGLRAQLALCVAPDCDAELRRLVVENRSRQTRRVELTVAAELALDHPAAFDAHPAFSKLFVETRWDAARGRLIARRRPRASDERVPWLGQALLGAKNPSFETDRFRFLGRGGTAASPAALHGPLSGRVGAVLDPVLAWRETLVLPPGATAERVLVQAAAYDGDALAAALDACADFDAVAHAFAAAEAKERARLADFGFDAAQGAALDDWLCALVHGHPGLRAPEASVRGVRGHVSALSDEGFGDRPLVVARLRDATEADRARELFRAHRYFAAKGVGVDVLLLGADADSVAAARELAAESAPPAAGHVAVWHEAEQPPERVAIALAWASAVVDAAWPALPVSSAPALGPARFRRAQEPAAPPPADPEPLRFANAYGGFSSDGREYVVRLAGLERPPQPWVNVLANPEFGALVSESGAANTWSRNSREHRLTPWSNDPVSDPHGEALYLRDEDAGVFWSLQPGPAPDGAAYEVRHGFGVSRFAHTSRGIAQQVEVFVPPKEPVKIARVRLHNRGPARRVSLFWFARLLLGASAGSARSLVTRRDVPLPLLLATNPLAGEFAEGVCFASVSTPAGASLHASCDRAAFLGRHGSPAAPAALTHARALDERSGAGLDPCFAWQVSFELPAGARVACSFVLGEARDLATARGAALRYAAADGATHALAETRAFWNDLTRGVRSETPMPALDLLVNGWLAVQAAACRLWGRTAFHQSGGAFGFRDQLQDALALSWLRPSLAREQILLHAAHQFVEGDVLHWWHPPLSRGTRTRCSDDLLWLPHLTAQHLRTTGDTALLDESVGFRSARPLAPDEGEAYLDTQAAPERASLYEHCARALDRSLALGSHGLPLIGTCDWNDGLNRVGHAGRGESVWLGFFLFDTLRAWMEIAESRGDATRAQRWREAREALRAGLDAAWDGAWYRRAYDDDGVPLGSAGDDECRIDALVQAWAVISGEAPPERARASLDAVRALLELPEEGLIRLLTPPFDRTPRDPGYIKGYVPGVRENGGQYSHAAMWVVRAEAMLGRRERAAALLERLTPVWHGAGERIDTYQVEPYVVAADVYAVPPHVGRGGWTWYTGAAGWMLRVALESVLGVAIESGDTLVVRPCVPDAWPGFRLALRLPDGRTHAALEVTNPQRCSEAVVSAALDGAPAELAAGAARVRIPLDGKRHRVALVLGAAPRPTRESADAQQAAPSGVHRARS